MKSIKEQVLKELKRRYAKEFDNLTGTPLFPIPVFNDIISITTKKTKEQILKEIEKIPNKELAELFHNKYEETSRLCGWNTQDKCKVKFKDLPKPNRNTMLITIAEIKKQLKKRLK